MDKGLTPNTARGEGYIATRTNTWHNADIKGVDVHLHPMVRAKSHTVGLYFHTLRKEEAEERRTMVDQWCEQGKPKQIYVGRIDTDTTRIQYYVHMNPRHESFYQWGYDKCPICGATLYYSHYLAQEAIRTQTPLEVLQ